MNLPIIYCVDDDQQVLRALSRDLKGYFKGEYKILYTDSAIQALEEILSLKNKGDSIALFISDQRMPEMEGIVFLEKAMKSFPEAKRALLTAYADTEAAIKAINTVQLDYYLIKPWDPPELKLFPILTGLLEDWQKSYHPAFSGIKVVGYQFSQFSHNIKDFLSGNLVPYQWLDVVTMPAATELLELNSIEPKDLPVVFFEDGIFLSNPGIRAIAEKIGLNPKLKNEVYDVVIIGAGPAGLAAGVYGASEGLKTLLVERRSPGGQAGTSSRIENYLGFPVGISGSELTQRAMTQAVRLGVEFVSPVEVVAIEEKDGYKNILLDNGANINTRSIVITTGVDYRRLDKKGIAEFTGAGIYYGAAITEASACKGMDVYVVGGGNSAGQAAMYLSRFAVHVHIIIRKSDLTSTMSAYLIDQINATPNIRVQGGLEIEEVIGSDKLEQIVLKDVDSGETIAYPAGALYIFIGAKPFTDWVQLGILKDERGFLQTGNAVKQNPAYDKVWKLPRDPYILETSSPGVFAAGDVKSGAMSRIASAVGEGSMAISFVHLYLSEVK